MSPGLIASALAAVVTFAHGLGSGDVTESSIDAIGSGDFHTNVRCVVSLHCVMSLPHPPLFNFLATHLQDPTVLYACRGCIVIVLTPPRPPLRILGHHLNIGKHGSSNHRRIYGHCYHLWHRRCRAGALDHDCCRAGGWHQR